mgnify:FL=1
MEIKDKIKQRREELGLTLEEVGNIVGVGKSTVRKWETGDIANMRRDKIAKLAVALRTSPAYLLGYDETEKTADPKVDSLSPKENELLTLYRGVNPDGQRYILQQAEFANSREEYRLSPAPTAKSGA